MIKKVLISFLALFILIFLTGFLFIFINNQPVSQNESIKVFTVKSGEGIKSVAQKLEENNLIKNKYIFLFYSYRLGLNQKIQAGNFKISPNLTTKEVVVKLSKSGVTDYWLKILEGLRVEELTDIFPSDSSIKSTDFIKTVKSKEGYIFPDSYLIPQYFTLDEVLSTIQTNFDKKFTQAKVGVTNTQLTDKQILTLASIIEHEARTLKVKQGVAGVLMNRLNINMPLQSDVTVQYARDSKRKPIKYWEDLAATDIKSTISPYNTYLNTGLPPAPICNPGFDSLYAAFHPTESDYLYYLTGDDGVMYYAKTLSEHNLNIANHLK
jgi:UPF0755 protein